MCSITVEYIQPNHRFPFIHALMIARSPQHFLQRISPLSLTPFQMDQDAYIYLKIV